METDKSLQATKLNQNENNNEDMILFLETDQIEKVKSYINFRNKIIIGKNSKGNVYVNGESRLCGEDWKKIFRFDKSKLPSICFCINYNEHDYGKNDNNSKCDNNDNNDNNDNSNNNNIGNNKNSDNFNIEKCKNDNNKNCKQCCQIGINFFNSRCNTKYSFVMQKISAKIPSSTIPSASLRLYINGEKFDELFLRKTTVEMMQKTTSLKAFKNYPRWRLSCGKQAILSFEKNRYCYLIIKKINDNDNNDNNDNIDYNEDDNYHVSIGYCEDNDENKLKLLLQLTNDNIGKTVLEFTITNGNSSQYVELKYFDGQRETKLDCHHTNENINNHMDVDDSENNLNNKNENAYETTSQIIDVIETNLFLKHKNCNEFANEIVELWQKCNDHEKQKQFPIILKFFFEFGWISRTDVIALINKLVQCPDSKKFVTLSIFYYYQQCHRIDDQNVNNTDISCNIVEKWIKIIFDNSSMISELCDLKTSSGENIIHLMTKSDLKFVKTLYDELMIYHLKTFVQLLSQKNKNHSNPLHTSTSADNFYYVMSWLLNYYETLHNNYNNNNNDDMRIVMRIFGLTHETVGNILHILARNANVQCGKHHTVKDLWHKLNNILQKTNEQFWHQLHESRIPTNNKTPNDILNGN